MTTERHVEAVIKQVRGKISELQDLLRNLHRYKEDLEKGKEKPRNTRNTRKENNNNQPNTQT